MALLHHEADKIPATLAAMAAPHAFLQADGEGGRSLLVKGTPSPPLPTSLLERRPERLNGLHDIGTAHGIEAVPTVFLWICAWMLGEVSCPQPALALLRDIGELVFEVGDATAQRRVIEERVVLRYQIPLQKREFGAELIAHGS